MPPGLKRGYIGRSEADIHLSKACVLMCARAVGLNPLTEATAFTRGCPLTEGASFSFG